MGQRRRQWLEGSALVIVLALTGAACGDDDKGVVEGGSTTVSTAPSTTVTPTTVSPPTSVPVDYSKPAAPKTIGTGFIAGTSRDGSAVYVEEEDPTFPEPGCEGQPAPVLFRLPVGGGERQLLATKAQPVRGQLERATGGKVALIDGCEGFLSTLYVGTDTPDGRLGEFTKVALPDGSGGGRPAPSTLTFTVDGTALVGADNLPRNPEGNGGTPIVRLDPSSGKATDVFTVPGIESGVFQVAEMADHIYAVSGGGRVQIFTASGELKSKADGNGFALSPDRRTLAVYGPGGVSSLTPGGNGPQPLVPAQSGRQIDSAQYSPDGRTVAYVSSGDGGNDNQVELVVVASKQVVPVVGPGPYGRVYFTGDGKAVVMNRFQSTPANTFPVVVVRFE